VSAETSHPAAALAPAAPLLILDDMGKSIGADLEIWKNRSASDLNHSHVWRIASSEVTARAPAVSRACLWCIVVPRFLDVCHYGVVIRHVRMLPQRGPRFFPWSLRISTVS
jgi:hypothetical protein